MSSSNQLIDTVKTENLSVKTTISWIILILISIIAFYLIISGLGLLGLIAKIDPRSPGTSKCINDRELGNLKGVCIANLVLGCIMFLVILGYMYKRGSVIYSSLLGISVILCIIGAGIAINFVIKLEKNIDNIKKNNIVDIPCINEDDYKLLRTGIMIFLFSGGLMLFSNMLLTMSNCPNKIQLTN